MPGIETAPGASIPSTSPLDLRRLWDFINGERAAREKFRSDDSPRYTPAFDPSILADRGVSGSPNYFLAVWLRTCIIEIAYKRDLLGPWMQAEQLNESVFQLAATWPLTSIEEFKPLEFIASL